MRIIIASPSFGLTPAIAQHVENRVSAALATANHIEYVTVRLEDINGNRGGADKQCRISVRHPYLPTLQVEATHQDLYIAINEAAAKIKENLWRHMIRRRTLRRPHYKRPQWQMMA